MNLEITSYNNQYRIRGVLNKQNVYQFNSEFKNIFEKFDSLTLSIEGLTNIDRYGVNALAQLHNESIAKRKSLSIIGFGCDDLYEHFKSEENAA
ncbi:MAG TPA: hypothetical protein PKL92_08970 [Aquaticitalea sp.]|nr:hypothetical protein [Aquaticitalea sp.]HNU58565.1 hypothetical protein [Aquaticitalea sp.]